MATMLGGKAPIVAQGQGQAPAVEPLHFHHVHLNSVDPEAAAAARNGEVAQKESKPLTVYERSVFMVRLPDGQLQLVSQ